MPIKDTPVPKDRDFAYYLFIFMLEGHTSWRCILGQQKDAFLKDQKNWGRNPAKITKQYVLRIDRVTGQIQPLP